MPYYRPIFGPVGHFASDCVPFAQTKRPIVAALRFSRGQAPVQVALADVPKQWIDRWQKPRHWGTLDLSEPQIMGILNVTPDSFSDGGAYTTSQAMEAQIHEMVSAGAQILDIGGESTRPGAKTIPAPEEIARITNALDVARSCPIHISIDTRKSEVAKFALEKGAHFINDVSGFTFDPKLAPLATQTQTPVCIMHAQGDPQTMQENPQYENVLLDVYDFLAQRVDALKNLGLCADQIIVDPGIGFGKTQAHNLEILRNVGLFHGLGVGVLIGVSRKKFIGTIGNVPEPRNRFAGSMAVGLACLAQGVQVLRVHDVEQTRQAVDLFQAVEG